MRLDQFAWVGSVLSSSLTLSFQWNATQKVALNDVTKQSSGCMDQESLVNMPIQWLMPDRHIGEGKSRLNELNET